MDPLRAVGEDSSRAPGIGPAKDPERSGGGRYRQENQEPGRAVDALAVDVFERHPYGIVVVSRHGEVLAHNVAARRLLGDLAHRLDVPGARPLCPWVCCRDEGGMLADDACLFERAADAHEALPEVRVDLPPGAGAPALWITAAPLRRDGGTAIVEMRPGQANDRRRRTIPHWTHGPTLRIFVLGRTRVESVEGPIGGRWLENRAGQVFKFLVAERHRVVYADELVETLWADAGVRSLPGVRYFIHELRDRLEPGRPRGGHSSFVLRTKGGYMIDRSRVRVDADEFERDVNAGLAHLETGEREAALEDLERGIAMYGGDFMADEPYADWVIVERDRLRRVAAKALRALSDLRAQMGDIEGAAADLERLAELEPYDVDVHRKLITIALRLGRRTEAVRRYDTLRRRMFTTFGEDLDFTLADVGTA
ncbi:MAG TPA: bacterial transcriptional activator domain-containing protein [Solirubrobacteraceae bacterium]|nr:bacterial transcriptional activator domain-containing protein [Solirubrobacteraceae bacterium]